MKSVSVQELKTRLDNQEDFQLIDIREQWELDTVKLEAAQHIPMGEIPQSMDKISREKDVVIMCRSGNRSASICQYLEDNGISNIINLDGGITAWATEIDTTMPTY